MLVEVMWLLVKAHEKRAVPSLGIRWEDWALLRLDLKEYAGEESIWSGDADFPYPHILIAGCEVFPLEFLK